MREVAVLKWHKEGCYATALATLNDSDLLSCKVSPDEDGESLKDIQTKSSVVGAVQSRRNEIAQNTHWLAVGSKDGKVSLWDIY